MPNADSALSTPHSINSPFFVTGGTLPLDAASYVARAADEELYRSLRRGEFCYVLNTRQMGKSSLMIRAAQRLRKDGRQVVVLDLTGAGLNLSVEQWYFGLLDLVAMQTQCEDALFAFWKTHRELGPMQRFVAALQRVLPTLQEQTTAGGARELVIFIDEIDAVRSLPFSADEFFAGIRECCNRNAQDSTGRRLVFCLLGVATPSDLIRDTRVTPFNIGRRIELHDFTRAEAAPLAVGLQIYRSVIEAEFLLERVLYWTSGHPYMTQRLCRAVAESLTVQEQNGSSAGQGRCASEEVALVDTLCRSLFLTKAARETDDNLAFVRSRLLHNEEDRASLLELYGQVRRGRRVKDDETNPLCPVLRLSGVVKTASGWLVLRNEIYSRVFDAAWIAEYMPDAEVRRQKRAFRLGILRTASVAALLLAVVSGLGARAYFSEQNARASEKAAQTAQKQAQREADHSNRLLYATQMNLLQRAYEEEDIGRARDLLAETAASPYRGFEWNYWNRLLKRERLAIPIAEPQSLIVWSRDGRWIVTQTQSTLETPRLALWDAKTGNLVRALVGRADALPGVASPVSSECVALVDAPQGKSGTVRLVNPTTGVVRHTLPVRAMGATLSGDGKRAFTLEPQKEARTKVKVWDVAKGTLLLDTTVSGTQLLGTPMQTPTVQSTRDSRLLCFGSGYTRNNCPLTLLDTMRCKRLWAPSGTYNRYGLSPRGRFLVATTEYGYTAGRFQIWDLQAKKWIAALRRAKPEPLPNASPDSYMLFNLCFSPDEEWIAGAGEDAKCNGSVWLWDTATGKEQRALTGHRKAFTAEFSPNGRALFSTSRDNKLRIWDTGTWKAVGVYSNNGTNPPVPSPDGEEFLTVDHRAALVYSLEATRPAEKIELSCTDFLGFTADSRHVHYIQPQPKTNPNYPYALDRHIIYDLETGKRRALPVEGPNMAVGAYDDDAHALCLKPLPRGGTLYQARDVLTGKQIFAAHEPLSWSCCEENWPDLALMLWDKETPAPFSITRQAMRTHHPQIVVWDAQVGKEIARLTNLPYKPSFIILNGTHKLVIVDMENIAHFWSLYPLREVFQVSLGGETRYQANFSVSPDGKTVSVRVAENYFDGRIEMYDFDSGRRCALVNEHAFLLQPINAFSPDGKYRIWADTQQNVHLMEAATRKEVRLLKSVGGDFEQAAFSPDSKRIVTGTNVGTIKLWDVETGSELMTLSKKSGEVNFLWFSRDGTQLSAFVSIFAQSRAFIWNARSPEAAKPTRE